MPAPKFFHYAGILILFAWSGVLLYFFASGRVDFLLKGWFRYGPLLGGLGLAVMGFFNLFTANADVGCGHDHHHPHDDDHNHDHEHDHHHHEDGECCHHDHDHEHEHHHEHTHDCGHDHDHDLAGHSHDDQTVPSILATMVIVLVPTLAAASMARDSFTVDALANKGLYSNEVNARPAEKASATTDSDRYTLADLEKQVRKSEEGNFLIPVPSLFYSAADEELADVLKGQPVETTGQVAPEIAENDPDGTRLRFYRLFVSCCLADARPIGFSAEFGKAPPEYAQDSWVKIVGEMIYPEQDGRKVPVLKVNTIEAIPEPKDMMY